jgi:hypothetical protein
VTDSVLEILMIPLIHFLATSSMRMKKHDVTVQTVVLNAFVDPRSAIGTSTGAFP